MNGDDRQSDIFAPRGDPLARTSDPDQSHRGHRRLIFQAIVDHPGRTHPGLAKLRELGALDADAISKGLTGLHRRGLIEPGLQGDPSTRRARRWFATAEGRDALEQTKRGERDAQG